MDLDRTKLVQRGERAQAILSDPIVVEAFAHMEAEILRYWRNSDGGDTGNRERLWLSLKLLDGVKNYFQNVVMAGRVAEHQITEFLKPIDTPFVPQA